MINDSTAPNTTLEIDSEGMFKFSNVGLRVNKLRLLGEWSTEKGEDNDNSDDTISKKVCGNVKIGNLSHANKVIKSPYIWNN